MNATPVEILDTLLGYLGFVAEVKEEQNDGNTTLQILTNETDRLIGRREEVMDDLQYLVNRILASQTPSGARIIVDVQHYRSMRDDALVAKVRQLASAVRASGRPMQTAPLNSYDRRIVHNAFKDDPELTTWSPPDDARVKRITIRKRPVRRSDSPA
jgi:spoIIIJ-associated protein